MLSLRLKGQFTLIEQLVCNILHNIAVAASRPKGVSCKAKKKQHACTSYGLRNHYSELFTRMAALKFENAVTQQP